MRNGVEDGQMAYLSGMLTRILALLSPEIKFFWPFLAILSPFWSLPLCAQSSGIPLNAPGNALLQRLMIVSGVRSPIHPSVYPYTREDALSYVQHLDSLDEIQLSPQDRADLQYLRADNNEYLPDSILALTRKARKGIWKHFYPTGTHLFEVNAPDFHLRVNPMLHFLAGVESEQGGALFQNQRGLEIRGEVDEKLFFYSNLVETQARYPQYVVQRTNQFKSLPGAGFFKNYAINRLGITDAYDFNVATAYIGYQATRHVGIQFGHGRHFIGNGYRSMFLSNVGAPTFFLRLDTRVGRLHYQNLFLELNPVSQVQIPDGVLLPKKYVALHYLRLKATKNLAIGFFEATVLNRSRQFEWQYLNPVIFYRTVEGMIGSPDNVLLGTDFQLDIKRSVQVYGQFLLDELVTGELLRRRGWWGNKWALQVGVKYFEVLGINHLDLQIEHNRARPYAYAHGDSLNSYTHYSQMLAHPLGANFEETVLLMRWQVHRKCLLEGKVIRAVAGENEAALNWGSNPLISYDTRVRDYGNTLGQGRSSVLWLAGLNTSWRLGHNCWSDVKWLIRKKNGALSASKEYTHIISLGLRVNLWNPEFDF